MELHVCRVSAMNIPIHAPGTEGSSMPDPCKGFGQCHGLQTLPLSKVPQDLSQPLVCALVSIKALMIPFKLGC